MAVASSTKGDKKNLAVVRGEGIQKRKNTLLQEFKKVGVYVCVCVCVCVCARSAYPCHASVRLVLMHHADTRRLRTFREAREPWSFFLFPPLRTCVREAASCRTARVVLETPKP